MNNSRVLILSDTHFPYEKPMYFNWIKKLKAKINPTNVIHIGDLADFNSLSFYDKSPSLKSASFEIADAKKKIRKLKPKKQAISADMLDTANTYDDKVAVIRMIVSEEAGKVSNVFKEMISKDMGPS